MLLDIDVESHPLSESSSSLGTSECKICCEPFTDTRKCCELPCQHGPDICEACISHTSTCPFCRHVHDKQVIEIAPDSPIGLRASQAGVVLAQDGVLPSIASQAATIYNYYYNRRKPQLMMLTSIVVLCMMMMYISDDAIENTSVDTVNCTYMHLQGSDNLCKLTYAPADLSEIGTCDKSLEVNCNPECYVKCYMIPGRTEYTLITNKFKAQFDKAFVWMVLGIISIGLSIPCGIWLIALLYLMVRSHYSGRVHLGEGPFHDL